jgi:hypothetical protein
MLEAIPCEPGHTCGPRTTRTVMITTPTPAGYSTRAGARGLKDADLCESRHYCQAGTADAAVD